MDATSVSGVGKQARSAKAGSLSTIAHHWKWWGVLCPLLLLINLAQADARWHFRATIGVDDGVLGRPGSAVFRVFVGEEKVYESPVLKAGDNP
ncbi:MAG: NPCBM/NEW2 domain-containing protein, partial [bacterium]|nr:NPCBM/NEW2 domain-containing protein [bacterium]